ncbi:hypothetical protein QR680_008257 [Steinernema hermaphroditum]|uniref:Uncharacterized protein n=1 Tax=Steinernema hermaphroditum TaxID=289476 RepID=A0AA39IID7_9BILA|nr:hypothetical protein QR680_008257 [Steinernema hermaphroditum]
MSEEAERPRKPTVAEYYERKAHKQWLADNEWLVRLEARRAGRYSPIPGQRVFPPGFGARERAEDNLFQHCDCNLCKADRCEPEPITVWSSENHCGNKFQKLGRRTIPESFGPSERRPPDPSDDKPIVFERCIGINMRFVVQRVEKTWEELKQYKDWNELFGIVKDDFIPEKPAGWNELLEEMRAEQRLLPEQKPFDFQKPPGWEQNLRAAERRSDEERVKTEQEYTTMAACFRKLIVDAHVAELSNRFLV